MNKDNLLDEILGWESESRPQVDDLLPWLREKGVHVDWFWSPSQQSYCVICDTRPNLPTGRNEEGYFKTLLAGLEWCVKRTNSRIKISEA